MTNVPDDAPEQPGPQDRLDVDARALRGLAHPLRGRILEELQVNGPATATLLGERLGESSGSTSYHLRQLARYGFIEGDPGHTGGRERWWRTRPDGWSLRGREFLRDPGTRQAAEIVLDRYFQGRRERFDRWNALVRDDPGSPDVARWSGATGDSVAHLRMTAEEAEEFSTALIDFVQSWSRRFQGRTSETHPDTVSVEIQTNVFPNLPGNADGSENGDAPTAG